MYRVEIIPRLRERSAQRYLEQLDGKVKKDVSPILRKWRILLLREIEHQFDVGGDPRWKKNRPSTIESKGHNRVLFGRGGGSKIRDTIFVGVKRGALKRGSLQAFDTSGHGQFHQKGCPGPWTIRPRDPGGWLVFKIGDRWVKTKKVTHPGLPRRSFIVVGIGLSREFGEVVWDYYL